MPALDFKEIPQANAANGQQDTFELFARDFLTYYGFTVESGPDRGQDGGRDLIVVETRQGVIGTSHRRWLVSCKHKAHSGGSVLDGDEQDPAGRMDAHQADGFMGFYSTIPSAPLARKLDGINRSRHKEVAIFDREKIEGLLLAAPEGQAIAKRYFPVSFRAWEASNTAPANIFTKYEPLNCCYCDRDLLEQRQGVVAFAQNMKEAEAKRIDAVYWACHGECDRRLELRYRARGYITGWESISDLAIPFWYIRWVTALMSRIQHGRDAYSDEAYESLKEFIIAMSQTVLRNQSEEQTIRVKSLLEYQLF